MHSCSRQGSSTTTWTAAWWPPRFRAEDKAAQSRHEAVTMSARVVRYVVSHENSDSNNHHDAVGEGVGTRAGERRPAGGGAALCHHRRAAGDGGRRAARSLCLLDRRESAARAGDAAGEGSRANAQAARADTRATRGARAVSMGEAYDRPELTIDARRSPPSGPIASLVNGAT